MKRKKHNVANHIRVSEEAIDLLSGAPNRDKMLVGLSLIWHARRSAGKDHEEFTPISRKTLIDIFGKNYSGTVIKPLAEAGLIAVNHSYGVRDRSKSYRILSPFNRNLRKPLIEDIKLLDKLEKLLRDRKAKRTRFKDVTQKNLRRLRFDRGAALADFEKNKGDPLFTPERQADCLYDIDLFSMSPRMILARTVVSDTNGRQYSDFSRLSRNLRQYLTVDGKQLIIIDLQTSQPYFAKCLYDDLPQFSQVIQEQTRYTVDVTGKKCLYEILHGRPFANKGSRDKYKLSVLTALYSDHKIARHIPAWQNIANLYPILAAEIVRIKQENGNSHLPIRLQTLESDAIIKGVMIPFSNREAEFFILDLFDGVIVIDTAENRKRVSEIIKEECRKIVGIEPILTIEKIESNKLWTFKKLKKKKIAA